MREQDYKKILTNFIEEEKKTIGQVAVSRAERAEFLTIEDDGTVRFDGTIGESELRDLIDIFEDFQGDSVKGILKRATEKSKIETSFLPQDLLPPSRDRSFWAIGGAFIGVIAAISLFSVRQKMFALHGAFIGNLIGPEFMSMQEPAFLFSVLAAFVIGMGHDMIPCSIPVWTTLLPSGDNEDSDAPLRFLGRSTKYFIGSAAVLATFGFILGFFGQSLQPLLQSVTESMTRIYIAGALFGIIGGLAVAWGLKELGLIDLPSLGIRNRIRRITEDSDLLDRSILNGMVFGGVEVSCPFPTYHLLLFWIVLVGNPLYGAFLLTVFILGKTLPIVVIGLLMRSKSGEIFERFKIGHSIFHIGNGALLIGAGSFLIFVLAQMVFIGPKGTDPIIIFRLLQAFLGLGVAYTAAKIYTWTNPHGWRYLSYSGLILAVWSLLSLPAYAFGLNAALIDSIGATLFAVLISLSITHFVDTDLPIDHPSWFSMEGTKLYLLIVLASTIAGGMTVYGTGNVFYTLVFGSSPLLLVPALIGTTTIVRQSRLTVWSKFNRAVILLAGGILFILYSAAACGQTDAAVCSGYSYQFVLPASVPVIDPIVTAALVAPLLTLLSVVYFAEGSFIFYHRMYEPVQKAVNIEGNRLEQLVRGTVERTGDIIGTTMAQKIIKEALEDKDDISVTFDDDEPHIRMGVSIENEEMFEEVVDILEDAFNDRVGEKVSSQVTNVAQEVRGLEKTQDDEEDTYRCDVCEKTFDSERGLHIHQGQKHED